MARNEEISRPQTSSDCSAISLRETEAKNLAASKVSSAELLKSCLQLPHFPRGRPFPVFCPCNWWWENKCPCRFYSNKYMNRRLFLPLFPPQYNIILLFRRYSNGVFLFSMCKRIPFLWFAFEFSISVSVKNTHIWNTDKPAFSDCWYGDFPFSQVCLCKVFLLSLCFIWKTQCIAYMNWRMLHWVGNWFGIIWLLRRSFSSSHFFKSRSKQFDWFSKLGVANSLDLACMAIFLTSLNIDLTSGDQICTISNILCVQLGKQEVCECRRSLSLTGFIKFNRVQHKHGWIGWPLYKISHRYSMSLLS